MALTFQFASNPQNYSKNPGEAKIAEMKKEQEAKRAELLGYVEEYREKYEASKKDYAEAQSIFLMQQRELAKHNEEDHDYEKYEKEYKNAKKSYRKAGYDQELRLQLLQFRTENYTKACRTNLLDLA